MRMVLRGLLRSLLIVLTRIRDGRVVGSWSDILARLATGPIRILLNEVHLMKKLPSAGRRTFLSSMAAATAGMMMPEAVGAGPAEGINLLGPKPGYSPQVGTLVSMLTWMRPAVTRYVKDISQTNLDYLFDANANSIGALLLHLAATETLYQINTFEGVSIKDFPT